MNDRLGKLLAHWRARAALTHVKGRLLDIGCGFNYLVKDYYGSGIGVDITSWPRVDLVVQNCAKLPWPDQSFDTISILAALNHMPNREEVLCECNRLLSPQGLLVVTMLPPRISEIWHQLRSPWDDDQSGRLRQEGEVWGLSDQDVRSLIRQAGFNVVSEKRFMLGVNRLTLAVKWSSY